MRCYLSIIWPGRWDGFVRVFKFLLTFAISVVLMWRLFEIGPWEAAFLGTAAYAVQHIAYNLAMPIFLFAHFPSTPAGHFAFAVSMLAVYVLVYGVAYRCIGQRMQLREIRAEQNRALILFVTAMLTLVVLLNYTRILSGGDTQPLLSLTLIGYSVIGCVFALYIQFFLVQQLALRRRLEFTEKLLQSQREQFHISEETIECVNTKCLDMKYRIAALRSNLRDQVVSEALRDVEDTIMIYDACARTGNEALDVILTEKSLLFERNGIQLTCMADGSALCGIAAADLYALFGNLLDNAIESARQIQDPERRVIGLTVQRRGTLALIHSENYFDHPIRMEDGVPETTKSDARYHGFGIRSMQLLAERYGGTLSIQIDGDIFSINLILHLTEVT